MKLIVSELLTYQNHNGVSTFIKNYVRNWMKTKR